MSNIEIIGKEIVSSEINKENKSLSAIKVKCISCVARIVTTRDAGAAATECLS